MNVITDKVNSISEGMEEYENTVCSENVCGWLYSMHLFGRMGRPEVAGEKISYGNIEAVKVFWLPSLYWKILLPLPDNWLCDLDSQVPALPAVSVISSLLGNWNRHWQGLTLFAGVLLHSRHALDYLLLLSPVVLCAVGY